MPSSLSRRAVAGVIAGIAAVAVVGTAATSFADSATSGISTTPTTATTSTTSGKPVTRLAGTDRIGTAIAISQQEFPNGGAGAVILTASYDFADAMSAGPLGKVLNAPLLLTTPGSLTPATLTEIQRVLTPGAATPAPTTTTTTANPTTTTTVASSTTSTTAGAAASAAGAAVVPTSCATPVSASATSPTAAGGTVYIIGGYAAIAQEVDTQLQQAGYNVVRIAGGDRFATSVDVAECEGSPTTVFLATGDIFADALSAGPAAAHVAGGGSVLLTNGKIMPPSVSQYLATLTNPTVYGIGAAAALADPQATPVFGGDRFATSALVANKFFSNPTVVGVATGADFPDALAGGAFMGVEGGPVLMSDPFVLPSGIGLYLSENQTSIGQAFLFGGTGALSSKISDTVSRLINNQP